MPEYLLKIRRYDPNSGRAAYWDEHAVELSERNSVLDAILKIRDEVDGSVGIRCSCQQAICGSCGVRMNGKPGSPPTPTSRRRPPGRPARTATVGRVR